MKQDLIALELFDHSVFLYLLGFESDIFLLPHTVYVTV